MSILVILAVLGLSSGCLGQGVPPSEQEKQIRIKLVVDQPQAYQSRYGAAVAAQLPDLEIELYSSSDWEKVRLTEDESPDVRIVSYPQYVQLVEEGLLYALDAYITRDAFDKEGLHEGVVQLLTEPGGGQMFGLAPIFFSQALLYNRELFDQYGIPHPVNGMSWDEVLELAGRFPVSLEPSEDAEDRLYGLYTWHSAYGLVQEIGKAEGLVNISGQTAMVVDTPEWWHIWERVAAGVLEGEILVHPEHPGRMNTRDNAFVSGRAAMSIAGLSQAVNSRDAGVQVGIVSPPVNPRAPSVNWTLALGDIFVIPADSRQPDQAWQLIKYIHGDQYARTKSKTSLDMSVRTAYMQELDGEPITAYYTPVDAWVEDRFVSSLPAYFHAEFDRLGAVEMAAVLEQAKTIEEALEVFQQGAQSALQEALQQESE